MGNPRGVKRDFDALEARRLRAAQLLKQGESQAEVARVLGVHRQTVHRWAKRVEREGRAALKKAGRAGRKPRLSAARVPAVSIRRRKRSWRANPLTGRSRWAVVRSVR